MNPKGNKINLKCKGCGLYFYKDRILSKLGDQTPYDRRLKPIVCPNPYCKSDQVQRIDKDFDPDDVPMIGSYSTKNEYNKEPR